MTESPLTGTSPTSPAAKHWPFASATRTCTHLHDPTEAMHEARPHPGRRAADVGRVHRGAAVDYRLEGARALLCIQALLVRVVYQALDDGRRREGGQRAQLPSEGKEL
ncbi:hypothetical protein [Ramlibacter sp.]|uniref:hypothetical protein n=1 Tax=Ramlibacter sp. TaxID=1917967 RepID=UPI0026098499|nr:hypothetical protein [Ramlibacter sp.]